LAPLTAAENSIVLKIEKREEGAWQRTGVKRWNVGGKRERGRKSTRNGGKVIYIGLVYERGRKTLSGGRGARSL